jgi:hypothetical protein
MSRYPLEGHHSELRVSIPVTEVRITNTIHTSIRERSDGTGVGIIVALRLFWLARSCVIRRSMGESGSTILSLWTDHAPLGERAAGRLRFRFSTITAHAPEFGQVLSL